jgi:predicted enzyme related to lactoylglutathione lyase
MASTLDYNRTLTCAIAVGNLKQALDWYQSVLGFEIDYRMDEMGWAELSTPVPGVTVGLSEVENPQVKGGATLVFGVRDIEAAKQRLETRKVRFDGDVMTIEGMVKLATFYDPDGNKFMLSQSLVNQG